MEFCIADTFIESLAKLGAGFGKSMSHCILRLSLTFSWGWEEIANFSFKPTFMDLVIL